MFMLRPIALAALVSGTLDIAFAMMLTLIFGRKIDAMLRYVASGPFPAASNMHLAGAILGVLVHFALMAVLATAFMFLVQLLPRLLEVPYGTGIAYGILTYFVMNWAVVPLRFGTPLPRQLLSIGTQLFAHIVLVGIPFALIAFRYRRLLAGQS
jgi:hypothetical protein